MLFIGETDKVKITSLGGVMKLNYTRVIFSLYLVLPLNQPVKAFNIEEAFVTFATQNYFPLLKVLLDSIKAFSSKPIIAFGINANIPFSSKEYPFLLKKRIDVDLRRVSIFSQKARIILESNIRLGVYVEADDVVNHGVDNLFELARKVEEYPLCPIHPKDPNDQQKLMMAMGVTSKSMPYVHGHIIFSERCIAFIREWYGMCLKYTHLAPNADETVLNVLLWKYNVKEYVSVFDPYYGTLDDYMNDQIPISYKDFYPINYYMFHGCKDPERARDILDRLIKFSNEKKERDLT